MSQNIKHGKVVASFECFLKEQGIYEEMAERAVKRVLAFQLAEEMKAKAKGITKVNTAGMRDTSRTQRNRLLDPNMDNVTLTSPAKAAKLMEKTIHLELG